MNYPGTNVFLLCFSVLDPVSAEQVVRKWVEEIRGNSVIAIVDLKFSKGQCPESPILLVGTKIDLRDNPKEVSALKSANGRDPITKDQGSQLSEGIGAHKYVE